MWDGMTGLVHTFDILIEDGARYTWPGLVQQPVKPAGNKPTTPLSHRVIANIQAIRDVAIRLSLRAQQDNG